MNINLETENLHPRNRAYISDNHAKTHNKENESINGTRRDYDVSPYREPKLRNEYKYSTQQRKFTYLDQNQSAAASHQGPRDLNKKIIELEYELQCQKNKYRVLEERTIESQKDMLEQLDSFQHKFNKLKQQKRQLEDVLKKNNLDQFKKIKGIADALIDMRYKVEGERGSLKEAWKWIKEVVAEHQVTRTHARKWKQAYDELHGQDSVVNCFLNNNSSGTQESEESSNYRN